MLLKGRVLAIAGSDSSGGAGIQADIKTITALGGYATTAITAITAQDTTRVREVLPIPPAMVAAQIEAVLQDIGADAIKTGMLATGPTIEAVINALAGFPGPVIVDPVLAATRGTSLLEEGALDALWSLLRRATLATPNIGEAERLLGQPIRTPEDMQGAATALRSRGIAAIVLKGGHLTGPTCTDMLLTPEGEHRFSHPRLTSRHTHGTGCTLASAIATLLAQSVPLPEAASQAIAYVQRAITEAPGLGSGHGPLNHMARVGTRT